MNPRWPIYIPSKGRSKYMVTSRALTAIGLRHFIVVEPQEVDAYAAAIRETRVLAEIVELPVAYKERYDTCDDLGLSKSTGPGPARNRAWDHAIASGAAWHWVIDDNITGFARLNRNLKVYVADGTIFRCMEDFVARYENLLMAGPNYWWFAKRKQKLPPVVFNTRIYSCNLIRNDSPFRWRGRYNEDTILSLDILKSGACTAQFNAFLQQKMETQRLPGGNTDEFYLREGKRVAGRRYADTGTVAKSRMLCRVHPDVAKMVWKFKRWHHAVDYRPFRGNRLIRKPGVEIADAANDYGMKLVRIEA